MKAINKEELFDRYGKDFSCRVWYKNASQPISYENPKHVKFKNISKITVLFKTPKKYNQKGETLTRDGASYIFKD